MDATVDSIHIYFCETLLRDPDAVFFVYLDEPDPPETFFEKAWRKLRRKPYIKKVGYDSSNAEVAKDRWGLPMAGKVADNTHGFVCYHYDGPPTKMVAVAIGPEAAYWAKTEFHSSQKNPVLLGTESTKRVNQNAAKED